MAPKKEVNAHELILSFLDLEREMTDFLASYHQLHGDYKESWREREVPLIDVVMETRTDMSIKLLRRYRALAKALADDEKRCVQFFAQLPDVAQRELEVD